MAMAVSEGGERRLWQAQKIFWACLYFSIFARSFVYDGVDSCPLCTLRVGACIGSVLCTTLIWYNTGPVCFLHTFTKKKKNSQPPPTSRFSTKIPRRRPAHPLWEALNPPCLSRFHAAVRPSLPNHRAGQCSSEIPPEIPMLSKPPHLHRCWLLRVVDFGCVSVLPSPNPTSI